MSLVGLGLGLGVELGFVVRIRIRIRIRDLGFGYVVWKKGAVMDMWFWKKTRGPSGRWKRGGCLRIPKMLYPQSALPPLLAALSWQKMIKRLLRWWPGSVISPVSSAQRTTWIGNMFHDCSDVAGSLQTDPSHASAQNRIETDYSIVREVTFQINSGKLECKLPTSPPQTARSPQPPRKWHEPAVGSVVGNHWWIYRFRVDP